MQSSDEQLSWWEHFLEIPHQDTSLSLFFPHEKLIKFPNFYTSVVCLGKERTRLDFIVAKKIEGNSSHFTACHPSNDENFFARPTKKNSTGCWVRILFHNNTQKKNLYFAKIFFFFSQRELRRDEQEEEEFHLNWSKKNLFLKFIFSFSSSCGYSKCLYSQKSFFLSQKNISKR